MKTKKYFKIAEAVASFSKDPSTQVGAVIVRPDGSISSTGYNGFIKGADESHMSFERPLKYHLTVHAEVNALLFNKDEDLSQHTLYVTHSPCCECLKLCLQKGLRKIVFSNYDLCRKFTKMEMDAIERLIKSTDAKVNFENISGQEYIAILEELNYNSI